MQDRGQEPGQDTTHPTGPAAVAAPAAALIPIKSFHDAKARLATTLDPTQRADLARWAATRVIAACHGLDVYVACEDTEVADWARTLGATALMGTGLGLNGSVDAAVATLAARGIARVLIAHGDLPLAKNLAALSASVPPDEILIVPDRRGDGTNLIIRPSNVDLAARYGPRSFQAHLEAALASGHPVTVRRDVHLGIDLDTEEDLRHPLIAPLIARVLHPLRATDQFPTSEDA